MVLSRSAPCKSLDYALIITRSYYELLLKYYKCLKLDHKLPKRSLDDLTPGVVLLGFVELCLAKRALAL